jgi:bifunctional non-homologous end joining protein LigD
VAQDKQLDKYRSMRDFSRTPEPSGGHAGEGDPTFVVQKHAATALHYDFRLQVDDVMPSWAVPKGPSYNPRVRRLAIQTEDHPLDYQHFEGIIPQKEYGGGQVIIWDRGTYERVSNKEGAPADMRESIANGHFTVMLRGEKLVGQWSLIRTGRSNGKDNWVMVKHKDEHVNADLDIAKTRPESVVSGRTIEELKSGETSKQNKPRRASAEATYIDPMLARLSKIPPTDEDWIFERKLDGLRCIAVRRGDTVELWSRNQLSFNARFPHIVDELLNLPVSDFVVDGEIVAFDGNEQTSFSALQKGEGTEPEFHVFDIIHLLGQSTTSLTLLQRKQLLSETVDASDSIRIVDQLDGSADNLLRYACNQGWEGIIAKRPNSKYASGRSSDWLKLKCSASQELVVGGWTEPQGSRHGFGALLLGYNDDSGLRYAGKVGTGFNSESLTSIHQRLVGLERKTSPFVDSVKEKTAHWARPNLVAAISFSEWTSDGRLRHPSFEGLRPDKKAAEVVRENE